ncbi:MAG TPA: hypothetical protein PK147_10540, partial [Saprospiraceae bacterium]|nr:hypothetical protein [Saprospiraceae bacterium]
MKILNIVLLTAVFLMITCTIHAQLSEMIMNSDLVIEGKVVKSTPKWNDDHTLIITENQILVGSIFKGSVRDSVIVINTPGGFLDDQFHLQTHSLQLNASTNGYFFLTEKDERLYTPSYGEHSFFRKDNATAKASLYVSGEKWSVERFESAIADVNRFPRLTYEENLQLLNGEGRQRRDTCDIIPSARKDNTMEFTFENVRYTNNFKNLDFDVMVKVNTPGLKFGRAQLYIDYSQEFGTSVIANNTVTVTRGIIIQDTTMYTLNVKDYASQIMSINIDSPNPGNTLFTLSENPESIIHVSLDITDFTQIGNISFDDIDVTGQVQYWCNGSYEPFDNVIFDEPIYYTNGGGTSGVVTTGITYTLKNPMIIENDTKFSIDIFAEATMLSKFSDADIYINYNEIAFGEDVNINGTAIFTRGSLVQDAGVYPIDVYDYPDNHTFEILIHGAVPNNQNPQNINYADLGTIPVKLGTIKFSIIDCDEDMNFYFNGLTIDQNSIHGHYTGIFPVPYERYSPVTANDALQGQV